MKLPARILLILGGVALAGAIGVLSYGGFETWKQYIALSANRSMAFMNPVGFMLAGAGLALLAGLFAGYALGLPRKPKEDASQLPPAGGSGSTGGGSTGGTGAQPRPADPTLNENDLR